MSADVDRHRCAAIARPRRRRTVLDGGPMTTVQDVPGPRSATGTSACRRTARWTTCRTASSTASSATAERAAALELTGAGPTLRVRRTPTVVALGGAAMPIDRRRRRRRRRGRRSPVAAGSTVAVGAVDGPGLRATPGRPRRVRRPSRTSAAARPSRSAASAATTVGPASRATCSTVVPSAPTSPAPRPLAAGLAPVLDRRRGSSACSSARTRAPEFLTAGGARRTAAHRVGGALQLGPHRRPPDRAPSAVGARRTVARPACTRPTSTTPATPSAPSTSPATCR